MPKLDKEMADQISHSPKVINDNIGWHLKNNSYRLQTRVLAPSISQVLELRGNIGKTNYGFTLLFEQLPIRRYENGLRRSWPRHTTPDGVLIKGPHKHTWDILHRDAPAYIPTDIDPNLDLNQQFFQFLQEENINLVGSYQHIMIEPRK